MSAPRPGESWRTGAALAFVLLVAALSLGPTLVAGFTNWDDPEYVSENPAVLHPSAAGVAGFFTSFYVGAYVPLTVLSFALDAMVWGGGPAGFHLTNLLLHLGSAALVFRIARRLDGRLAVATLTALFFAVHPLRVEAVAWLSARKDVLSTFLFFAALDACLNWIERPDRRAYLLSMATFAASLLAKSMGVTLPVVLLLVLWYRRRPVDRRILAALAPFAVLSALAIWVGLVGQMSGIGQQVHLASYHYLLVAARGLLFYLGKTVFPVGLAAVYPFPEGQGLPPAYWIAPLGVAALAALALWVRRRAPAATFGAAFFFVTILPVIQLVPFGHVVAADRFSYLPSFGLAFAAAATLAPWLGDPRTARLAHGVLAVVILILSCLTWQRCRVWCDSAALWDDAVAKQPRSELAHMLRARAHLDAGRRDAALADYRRVTELDARSASALNNRGWAWALLGDDRRAIADFDRALAFSPEHGAALANRGMARLRLGDVSGALADFERALPLRPKDADLRARRGVALARLNDWPRALAAFDEALALDPDSVVALVNRGVGRAQAGRSDDAFADLSRAIAVDPNVVEGHYNRALILMSRRHFAAAIDDLSAALAIDPGHADARRHRAEAYLRSGATADARRDIDALRAAGQAVDPRLIRAAGLGGS